MRRSWICQCGRDGCAQFTSGINTCWLHLLVDIHAMGPATKGGARDTSGNSDRVAAQWEEEEPRLDVHNVTFRECLE